MKFFFTDLEICHHTSECADGQLCLFTDDSYVGECVFENTEEYTNSTGKT